MQTEFSSILSLRKHLMVRGALSLSSVSTELFFRSISYLVW